MGRDTTRTDALDLDYAAGIRKLSNGNIKVFYEKHLKHLMKETEFYRAMLHMEPITPIMCEDIESAYLDELNLWGFLHDDFCIFPTIRVFLNKLLTELEEGEIGQSKFKSIEEFSLEYKQKLRFYVKLINQELKPPSKKLGAFNS